MAPEGQGPSRHAESSAVPPRFRSEQGRLTPSRCWLMASRPLVASVKLRETRRRCERPRAVPSSRAPPLDRRTHRVLALLTSDKAEDQPPKTESNGMQN